MKAIRVHNFGEPDVMKLEEIALPELGKHEVLINVKASGVNPVDAYIRSGSYGKLPDLPYTPGTDAAGIIEAVGPGVIRFNPGDRVYCYGSIIGTYAKKTICKENQVHILPKHLNYQQGAAIGVPFGVAYRALFQKSQQKPGKSVLIHGATGGVGTAVLQLSRIAGLNVFATAGNNEDVRFLKKHGALHVANHHDQNHFEQLRELNSGQGFDIIIEMLANANLGRDLKILNPRGQVLIIGSRGSVEIDPRDLMSREAIIQGVLLFNATTRELNQAHRQIGIWLESGVLKPIVGDKFPLEDAPKAHIRILEKHALGKMVLI